jgi:hypothetical protein
MEGLNVSEQKAESTSGEPGSLGVGPIAAQSSVAQPGQGANSAWGFGVVDAPMIAPDHESPRADEPKVEASKVEVSKVEAPKVEAPKVEAPKSEASKVDSLKSNSPKPSAPQAPGKLLIMSPGDRDRGWDRDTAGPQMKSEASQGLFGKRRLAALAAVVALAVVAGALGGAALTASLPQLSGNTAAGAGNAALEASIARIDADIMALKASVEHTSQVGVVQFNKTSDRLDKVERAQAEPLAKLAKLSEAVDKLRATPVAATPVAAVPAAAREVTGSITPAAATPPKVEVARLPVVDGWVLRDVANGSALIENRQGMYEVFAGDPVPGLGKVDAIRRQDGRWVVVTSKGLIVAR